MADAGPKAAGAGPPPDVLHQTRCHPQLSHFVTGEAIKINRRREEKNYEGPAAARARSRAACGGGERARRSESTYAQQVDMMSRIVAHNRLRDGSLENATCARGTNRAKFGWRGKSRSFS